MKDENEESLQALAERLMRDKRQDRYRKEPLETDIYVNLMHELGNQSAVKPVANVTSTALRKIRAMADHKAERRYQLAVAALFLAGVALAFIATQLINAPIVGETSQFLKKREEPVIFAVCTLTLVIAADRLIRLFSARTRNAPGCSAHKEIF